MAERFFATLLGAIVWAIARLPRRWTSAVASLLAVSARPFAGRDLARLRANVHQIYGLPPGTHFAAMFERQVMRHQIECALETVQAIHAPAGTAVAGLDELQAATDAARAHGKPVLFVTAHLGSWELCAYNAQRAVGVPMHVLAKPARHAAVTRVLDGLRQKMGTRVLWTGSKTLLREMLGALKRGESLGFVMDQKPEGRQGPVVPFFGLATPFVAGPATMALKADASVIGLYCVREGPHRYRILSETLRLPGDAADELALTARCAASIERAIRLYPEQWTWSYKRWRFDEPRRSAWDS